MSNLTQFLRGALKVSYSNGSSGLTATTVQAAIDELDTNLDDLVSLSGVALNATNLGTFTGSTITDSVTVKVALQELETAVETKISSSLFDAFTILAADVDNTPAALTVGASTFVGRRSTGGIVAITVAQAQADLSIDDLITLSGVAEGSTSLGTFTGSTIPDTQTVKAALQALETAHEEVDANVNDLITLSGVAENATDLGTFTGTTIPDSSTIKAALQSLETAQEALSAVTIEWQDSALDYVVDNTVVPATEVTGDRYILSHDGGAPHANWDGASAGDIVEFNGTTWDALTPTTGVFISADDEPTLLYYYGGASWTQKLFEATTASTGLTKVGVDIRLDSSSAGNGLGFSAGVLSVNVDDSTIEINTDTLRVKDLGITTAKLAATSVTAAKLGSDVAGTGLTGGNGAAIDVDFSTTFAEANKAIAAAKLASNATGEGASIIGIEDAGGLITATDVEGALAENRTAIDAIEDNTITSPNGSVSVAGTVGADNQTVDVVFSTTGTANRSIEASSLASTTNGQGASMVGIEDAGGNFTSTDVEGALTEIDTRLDTLESGGTLDWIVKTAAHNAVDGEKILADTVTTGAFTISLPAGSVGDEVIIRDALRNTETAAVTIAPDGAEKIGGLAESLVMNVNGAQVHLVYTGATHGWSVEAA